ncbi:MAG: aminopeptidase P family protein [Alphaproteobacteria bacterium]|nr:aminopeptidase P family protein [Alphaproteobacteria bacterium]
MEFAATKSQQAERIAALRDVLVHEKLDGFLVPLADEYMNEYVPPSAQRLTWLTGFTGSSGFAVVLRDKAAFFTDGRYTIQAEQQVGNQYYELRHLTKNPLHEYLAQHVKEGDRIAYDPWLHTRASIEKIKAVLTKNKAKLICVDKNLIDLVWQNKPAAPMTEIFVHDIKYAGETSASKRTRLAKELKEQGLDAMALTSPPSIAWLLNVRGADVEATPLPLSYAILYNTGSVDWFVNPAKLKPETRNILSADATIQTPDDFASALKQLGAKKAKVRVDAQETPSRILDMLDDAGASVDAGIDLCDLPKACKNKDELSGIKAAHIRDGLALTKFLCWLAAQKPGSVTEIAAEDKLLEFRKTASGFIYPSFPSISGAGPHGAIVHYRATKESNRGLNAGELYLIDSGGQYFDGTTDVTRTLAIGTPSPQMKTHFTLVLKGHIGLAQAVFPQGTHGGQLDILARQHLWAAGLDYDHGTGHGVGAFLGVHEGPQSISGRSTVPLRAGMVISNEPGYYLTGAYGIRIENLVFVKESTNTLDGKPMFEFETLTLAPIDLNLVDASLLTASEKTWLNTYHATVFNTHAPNMNEQEKAWLKAATAPL